MRRIQFSPLPFLKRSVLALTTLCGSCLLGHAQDAKLYYEYKSGGFTFVFVPIIPHSPMIDSQRANRDAAKFLADEKKDVETITKAALAKHDVATLEKMLKEVRYQPRVGAAKALGEMRAVEAMMVSQG